MLWWIVETSLVAAGLAALAALACRWDRVGPACRHALWLIVLIKLATPPLVRAPWPVPISLERFAPERQSTLGPSRRVIDDPAPVLLKTPDRTDDRVALESPDDAWESRIVAEPLPQWGRDSDEAPAAEPSLPLKIQSRGSPMASTDGRGTWSLATVASWGMGALRLGLVATLVILMCQGSRLVRFQFRLARSWPAPSWVLDEVRELSAAFRVRPPEALVMPGIGSPLLWCLGRPKLLLPPSLLKDLDVERWRCVLAHELAHLRRRDPWVSRLELVAGAVWWWNPLYWLVRHRLHVEAELACDAWVVRLFPKGRRATALDGEALDAGFDRDAARRPQEVEHVGLPEVDAGLDAERDGAGHQRFEQRPLRQEDLVDEIDVSDALGHEAVDLDQQRVEIALPVFVAEVDLGAERAMVRATPGGLDLGPGADGIAVVTVMVVVMPVDPGRVPPQRRRIGEPAGRRFARDHDAIAVAIGDRRHVGETGGLGLGTHVREPRHDLLAFAPHHDVAAELAQRRFGCRRTVWADRDGASAVRPECGQELPRTAQFGRGAAPEQVARRRGHDRHGGREVFDRCRELLGRLAHEVPVEHQHLVSGSLQEAAAVAEFERQMGVAAAEIDRLGEVPRRIDEGNPHARGGRGEPARSGTI